MPKHKVQPKAMLKFKASSSGLTSFIAKSVAFLLLLKILNRENNQLFFFIFSVSFTLSMHSRPGNFNVSEKHAALFQMKDVRGIFF